MGRGQEGQDVRGRGPGEARDHRPCSVNSHNYGDPAWPFGGFKQSGWGREMGKEVMEHYTETKSVAINLV